jgi:hypothetical protein
MAECDRNVYPQGDSGVGDGNGLRNETLANFRVGLFAGTMIGVGFFTFFGLRIIKWRKERRRRLGIVKPLNYRKARKYKRMWIRFGLPGIALLTPIFFGPAIGAVIAIIFERSQMRIFLYMGVSIAVWSAIFALLGHQVLELIH